MRVTVKNLRPDRRIEGCFYLRSIIRKMSNNRHEYLILDLCNKNGHINGFLWRGIRKALKICPGSYVHIEGRKRSFQGKNLLRIEQLRELSANNSDLAGLYTDFPKKKEASYQEEFRF